MGSSGLLTGHHVTAAMVGETRQQHRPQTQQVRVMLVTFQFRVTLCLSALKSPCFLLCPAQMWGSHSHTGKDYGYPRGSRWPQGWENSQRAPRTPKRMPAEGSNITPSLTHHPPSPNPSTHLRKKNSSAFTPCFCSERKLPAQNKKSIHYLLQVPSTQAFKITR